MAAGSRGLEVAENPLQQPPLKQPIRPGRQLVSPGGPFQSLPLGQLADIFLDLPGQLVELFDVARLGIFGQLLHVDHADLSRLGRLFQLFQQPIDRFQLLLDFQRLGNGHGRAAGEGVFGRQLVDLIFVAQRGHQPQQPSGHAAALICQGVPEPLQVVELLLLDGLAKSPGQRGGGSI